MSSSLPLVLCRSRAGQLWRWSVGALAAAGLLSGCATVFNDDRVALQIETFSQEGVEVEQADCLVENGLTSMLIKTPAMIKVRRSANDLQISCVKADMPKGRGLAISRMGNVVYSNAILSTGMSPVGAVLGSNMTGVAGAVVDHRTGAAYNYSTWIRVTMGKTRIFDQSDDQVGHPNAGIDMTEYNEPCGVLCKWKIKLQTKLVEKLEPQQ